jgi:hypothetical protein
MPIERLSIVDATTVSSSGKSHTLYVIEVHSDGSSWQVFYLSSPFCISGQWTSNLRRNVVLQVKRRFREFEDLHAALNALSARPDLPPLPGKKFFERLET